MKPAFVARVRWTLCLLLVTPICSDATAQVFSSTEPPGLTPRHPAPKSLFAEVSAQFHRHDRLIVKFAEGSQIRLRKDRLVSLAPSLELAELDAFFRNHPRIEVERHFSRSEAELDEAKQIGQSRSGHELANLNLYFRFKAPSGTDASTLEGWLRELQQFPMVEIAFAEPIAELAVTTNGTRQGGMGGAKLPVTPDYIPMQGYLSDSPSGINADKVWAYPGGEGAGVKLIDIEGDWQWTHEDLEPAFFTAGTPISGWRDHGTAVIGEIIGQDNGLGIRGIASDVQVGGISFLDFGVAGAIDLAASNIDEGDIFLIELHGPGPDSPNGGGQYGYVPMEWWQDNFDAIQTAVANGRICVEAGGNGEQNLDAPLYQGLFDRNVRDSGAVLVGAGTPTGLEAEWFTNYGSRIDLNGWGSSIVTTGYGTLQGGDEDEWYTSGFGGTSGASPIICGAIASLQGMCKALWGVNLDATLAVRMLRDTGTPYAGALAIGPRPNLFAARSLLIQGVGEVHGTLRDNASGNPIPHARLVIQSAESGTSGRIIFSGPDGSYRLPLLSGLYTLTVDSFFHEEQSLPISLNSGQSLQEDIDLDLRPFSTLSGTITTPESAPLADVRIEVIHTPVPPESSNAAGEFLFPGLPVGAEYQILIGPAPGRQSAARTTGLFDDPGASIDVTLAEAETFENTDADYVAEAGWTWGEPGSGPGQAYSGQKLWATGLDSDYGPDTDMTLTSPTFDTAGLPEVFLTFNHWFEIETSYDGGQIEVWDGSVWTRVDPLAGYPVVNVAALDWTPGFSGASDGWEAALFDISAYASSDLRVRFRFASDGGVEGPGWYIEDVFVTTELDPSSVGESLSGTHPVLNWNLTASPNPFRESTHITFELNEPASVQLEIFDVTGRSVTSRDTGIQTAGRHTIEWAGTSDRGEPVAAGLLFYRLRIGEISTGAGQLLRVR